MTTAVAAAVGTATGTAAASAIATPATTLAAAGADAGVDAGAEAGVVPALLHCISCALGDFRVQSNAVITLFNLSLSQPDCVRRMHTAGAAAILGPAYAHHAAQRRPNEQILMLFTSLPTQLDEWRDYGPPGVGVGARQQQQQLGEEEVRGDVGAADVVSEAEDGGVPPVDEQREEAPATLAARCCAHSRPSRSSFQHQHRRSSIKDLRLFGDSFAAGIRDSEFEYRYVSLEAEEE